MLSLAPVRRRSTSEKGSRRSRAVRPAERLAYGVGEPELLAPGQNEQAVPPRLVRQNLQIGQEIGHTLDFIQDGPVAKPRKNPPGSDSANSR